MGIIPKIASRENRLEDRAEQLTSELLGAGKAVGDIISELTELGLSFQAARRMVTEVETAAITNRKRRAFRGLILATAVIVAGGSIAYASQAFDVGSPYNFIGYAILAYGAFSLIMNAWAYFQPLR